MQVNSIQFSHPTRKSNKTQINSVPIRDGGMKDSFELSAPSFKGFNYQKSFYKSLESGDFANALRLAKGGNVVYNADVQKALKKVKDDPLEKGLKPLMDRIEDILNPKAS